MRWPSFERANRFGDAVRGKRFAYVLGFGSALPAVLLTLDVALIAHALLSRNGTSRAPHNWLLQQFAGNDTAAWGWLGRADYYLLALVAVFVLLSLFEFLMLLFYLRTADKAALSTVCRLQSGISEQVPRVGFDDSCGKGAIRAEHLLTESSESLRRGLATWWKTFPRGVGVIGALLALALVIDWLLTLLMVLLAVFVWRVCRRTERQAGEEADRKWSEAGRRREAMLDQIRTVRTIAACSQDTAPKTGFDEAMRRYCVDAERAMACDARLRPLILLLVSLSIALLIVVIGLSPNTMLTEMAVLAFVLGRVLFPVRQIGSALESLESAERAAAEIFVYLDRTPAVGQITGATPLAGISREVRLDGVSVGHDTDGVLLDNVSFSFPAGGRVAVVSSREETTEALVKVLLRFRDPEAGRVLFDDVDIRTVSLESLRSSVAFAPADGMLFTGTVAENIRCGRSGYRSERVDEAAKLSCALEAIGELPHAFQTTVGPGGRTLAAGLAFQVGLARAVLADPSLMIIEEPPQPIDDDTDALIGAAIDRISANRTVIVLATRLPTLRDSETVIVFHEGRLDAHGPHPELLQQNDLYRHLNYKLFNAFRHI